MINLSPLLEYTTDLFPILRQVDDILGDIMTLESVDPSTFDNELNFIEPTLMSQTVSVTHCEMIFHTNSNSKPNSFCINSLHGYQIATNFCTWHDSYAVVSCAKFCCNHLIKNGMRTKWNYHRIWIVMQKSIVKWILADVYLTSSYLS